jgi:hypothetical protein
MVVKMEAKVTATRFEERSVAQRTELEKLKTETKRLERANEGLLLSVTGTRRMGVVRRK